MGFKNWKYTPKNKPIKEDTNILTNQVKNMLITMGCAAWRQNNIAVPDGKGGFRKFHGKKGVSDVIGILPWGQFIGVEIKTGNDKLSKDQEAFKKLIIEKKGIYLVAKEYASFYNEFSELFKKLQARNLLMKRALKKYINE